MDQTIAQYLGLGRVKDGTVCVAGKVNGNQRFVVVTKCFRRCGAHGGVDVVNRGVFFQVHNQFNNRYVRGRNADGHTVQFARQFRQNQADCLSRAGAGRNHRQRRRACTTEIFVVFVQQLLVPGVRMNRCHPTGNNAVFFVQNLGHGCQTVCCARCVGHN